MVYLLNSLFLKELYLTVSIAFVATLVGIVLLITLVLTLCALRMSSNQDKASTQHSTLTTNIPNQLLATDRRKQVRDDFPIACNDGSYAWFDRRRTAFK